MFPSSYPHPPPHRAATPTAPSGSHMLSLGLLVHVTGPRGSGQRLSVTATCERLRDHTQGGCPPLCPTPSDPARPAGRKDGVSVGATVPPEENAAVTDGDRLPTLPGSSLPQAPAPWCPPSLTPEQLDGLSDKQTGCELRPGNVLQAGRPILSLSWARAAGPRYLLEDGTRGRKPLQPPSLQTGE